ncbi:MAG: TolC family protein [Candidatus Thiodiazotropha sp. (ex Monitilora ramsayi)]|nr:TolC family protein [Candidatus Thiodiazotropha sp. (ex Monitilora ramsayi)]
MSSLARQSNTLAGLLLRVILTCFAASVWAQQPLPSPLSLEQALVIADETHPDRLLADAALAQAMARRQQIESVYDTQLKLTGELRAIDPSEIAVYQTHNDSLARLNLSKQLYDFGRTARAEEAADATLASREWRLKAVRQQRRLEVMQRFFAVLLADLKNARDNEALSIAFIRFDRASNRHELGKVSDVDLLELESHYQQTRRELSASGNQQRITRSQLAISLNRPTDLPADLVAPDIEVKPFTDDLEPWVEKALSGNPELLALRAGVEAARKRLQASEAADNPVLRGELEAATYERELGGRNPLTAALVFEVPLYTGSRVDAEAAEQRAILQQKEAELKAFELQIHQQVLEVWLALDRLRVEAEALFVTADFRDLSLDRSRTLYDLDMQTDLGDSMTQIADIQWRMAENQYDRLLLLARLKALTGSLLPTEETQE